MAKQFYALIWYNQTMKHLFLYALVPIILFCCSPILAADRMKGDQPSVPGKQLKIDEGEKEMEARRKLIAAAFAPPGASREDIESMANETFPVMEKLAQSEVKSPYCQWVLATWRKGLHAKVLAEGEKRLIAHPDDFVGILIKASWALTYGDQNMASNALVAVDCAARKIQSPTFRKLLPMTLGDIKKDLYIMGKMNADEYAADIKKAQRPGHAFSYCLEMVALDADGYFGSDEAPEKIDPADTMNLGDPFGFVPTEPNQREAGSI